MAGAGLASLTSPARADRVRRFTWTGTALGADARLVLLTTDERRAAAAVQVCLAEIDRLEAEFNLYRPGSALCRLNREGTLEAPSLDMRRLMASAIDVGDLSGGAFDVSVQPLWDLYAAHFASASDDCVGPDATLLAEAVARVDCRRIEIAADRIRLGSGMSVTLNGIAQGYITDRVADLLQERGWTDVLVELGEQRGLGGHPDGRPWRLAIPDPLRPGRFAAMVPLSGRAAATSSVDGTRFDRAGRFHHLLDPRTGRCGQQWASITVVADRATVADALSTALALTPADAAEPLLRRAGAAEAWLFSPDGDHRHLVA